MSETTRPIPDAARLAEVREWIEKHVEWDNGDDWRDTMALFDHAEHGQWHDPRIDLPDYQTVYAEDINGEPYLAVYDKRSGWLHEDDRGMAIGYRIRRWRELPR